MTEFMKTVLNDIVILSRRGFNFNYKYYKAPLNSGNERVKAISSGVCLAAFKSKGLRRALINHSCLELEKECRKIVRKKKSVLKCTSLEDVRKFKWSKLMKERVREAPTLYKVLRAIAMPPQLAKRKMQSLRTIIGTTDAMLLRARNAQMSAVQYLAGLSLFLDRTVCFKIFYLLHYCSCQKHHQ